MLTTKAQYSQGDNPGDLTIWTEIIGAERLAETDQHRLALAEKVLSAALTMLEFEITLDQMMKKQKEEKKERDKLPTVPQAGSGGYH
jgi:hypothetical protein